MRAHTTRTHIGVHLLSLRALRLVQYEFAVSAMWMWLVQYEFAVSAMWHNYILLSNNNIATGYKSLVNLL